MAIETRKFVRLFPAPESAVSSFCSQHQQHQHQHQRAQSHSPQQCPFITRARLLMMLLVSMSFTLVLVAHCMYPAIAPAVFYVCWSEQRRRLHHPYIPGGATSPKIRTSDPLQNHSTDTARHRTTPRRRLPQCLIIGVRKGGTRALLEFLSLHPSIRAHKSEAHFFDDDLNYSFGLEWYRHRMPDSYPEQITVEKTPAYFVQERVPERVQQMNSSVKLLLIMRDPVERAISDYMQIHSMRLSRGKDHVRFEDLAIDPVTGEIDRSYRAIERSIYHLHMAQWLKFFPLEQFHFVSGENLVRNPMVELRKVEKFLGIDHKLSRHQFYFNRTRGFYCMRFGQQKSQEKCLASSKGRAHPEISPNATAKLRCFFAPHNLRFYEMVGLDFGWNIN